MNSEQFLGQWNTLKGKAKEKWGQLTDDDLSKIDGKKDQLIGYVQKKYGISKEEAQKQVSQWENQIEQELKVKK